MPKIKKVGKRSFGSVRAKAGLPAKAGVRKLPANRGPHITTREARKHGRFLSNLGIRPRRLVASRSIHAQFLSNLGIKITTGDQT